MKRLTVKQRIKLITEAGWPIAWDECHKIYFLQDDKRKAQALEYGYSIHPSTELQNIYDKSCELRFISRWGFTNEDFEHEWNVNQFESKRNTK